MAPKRRRGSTSQAAPDYDTNRFVSKLAAEKYENIIDHKTFIPERGLNPLMIDGNLQNMIDSRHWSELVSQPEAAPISIVKEFYANASEDSNVVRIRGIDVHFDASHINAYYHLADSQDVDDYTKYRTESLNLNEVIRGLCQPDAEWVLKDGQPRFFPLSCLSRYGKAWYYFICAKLLPTKHFHEVRCSRAVLLYFLVNGKSINVGRVILGNIKHILHGGTAGGLPHPSLICGLCAAAGVEWSDDEQLLPPKVAIDSRMIANYNQWPGAPADPSGKGFILPVHSPDTEELFAATPPQEEEVVQPSLQSLADEMRQMRRESRRQSRQISYVSQQVNSFMQFSASFTNTLAEMFQRTGLNAGENPLQFPLPPNIPPPPPDSPNDDAEA